MRGYLSEEVVGSRRATARSPEMNVGRVEEGVCVWVVSVAYGN